MKKKIDINKFKKEVRDKHGKSRGRVLDMYQDDDGQYVVVTQTPRREKLGYPPAEIKNSDLGSAFDDLETIHGR